VALAKPIADYETVRTWARALGEHWEIGDPFAEDPDKLRHLEEFCRFIDMDPDALVAHCFLRRKESGERFASVKRREDVAARLKQHRENAGLAGLRARRFQSDVCSFLIHNGVLMQLGVAGL
jgi:hypothetical protein